MNEALEPMVTLGYAQTEDGTFTVHMTVSGQDGAGRHRPHAGSVLRKGADSP